MEKNEALKQMSDAFNALAHAKADKLAKELSRSVVRHSMKETIRGRYTGEKISETRIDDLAVSSEEYKDACTAEVGAVQAEGLAYATAETARLTVQALISSGA